MWKSTIQERFYIYNYIYLMLNLKRQSNNNGFLVLFDCCIHWIYQRYGKSSIA